MIDRTTTTNHLSALLEQHIEEIAEAWAEMTYHNASFHPGELWSDVVRISTRQCLTAITDSLRTGSHAALKEFLANLSGACLRSGLETGNVTEFLLLSKDAVLAVISRYDFDPEVVWAVNLKLDACLRYVVGRFNTLYAADMNRCLREQHEHIVSMLKFGEQGGDALDIDEVLHHVALGIMAAAQVEHCDFYLVDEHRGQLVPKRGISSGPIPDLALERFLNRRLNLAEDPFFLELLERKEPMFCPNLLEDPRVNKEVVSASDAKSIMAIPLVANHRVLAVALAGAFNAYRAFTDEQVELAWNVARAATLVIENARLHQQTRLMAALEEREWLAREIHDNLAQSLSILKLHASKVNELLTSGDVEQAQHFLTEMVSMASEAHTDAREAIIGLRSNTSSAADVKPTLEAYLNRFSCAYGVQTRLVVQDEISIALPSRAFVQLTRIVQEALANVRKHANAHEVCITLGHDDAHLTLTIEDDGQGFDLAQVISQDNGGVGLQIMRERAESLGGQLDIDTQPGRGTRIMVRISLPDAE
ncbi:MAG: GAF domain-containing sensor histidine kinase [Anaerolineae bacterium]|nr:GAF domain-containing sensor histidine kinase [Anaerolineae bacterium]